MKVLMLKGTNWQGFKYEGQQYEIPDNIAKRWAKVGIATYNESEESSEYASMKAKDLFGLCKERGIEVEAKKSRAHYIEVLEANDKLNDVTGQGDDLEEVEEEVR